jgi:RHS repeat-associated protein
MSVIAQYAPDGQRQAWYTQSLARIDEVLSVVNGQGKFWYQADALGSTYALANGAGAVVARGGYDVFGEAVAVSGNVGQPFGFTGREHERDSGLTYYRDRYVQSALGRWGQADRAGFVDGPNVYAYVSSRPTVGVDPAGEGIIVGPAKAVAYVAAAAEEEAGLRYIMIGLQGDNMDIVSYGLIHLMTGVAIDIMNGNCPANTAQLRGVWVEGRIAQIFRSAGYVVERGVRVATPFGERILDIVVYRAGTTALKLEEALFTIETKFGRFARWDKIQRAKDFFIERTYDVFNFVLKGQ